MLVRHILHVILTCHLMALTLTKAGFDDLEQVCREFVWGPGEQGNPKNALVAWNVITQPLLNGGMGII